MDGNGCSDGMLHEHLQNKSEALGLSVAQACSV